ncbi:MAG TPA: hypothetical protein IAB07_04620 [Candidatus Caccalectryoclostridium excrementigallinarum]|uniref:Uncharacterized protein n=1 Tax=Candidatus Caccalectryoclostridium excrementigallinarum TaxID=2840710 RepID=A0A9D1MN31_9FIRM|nr:hypothetical protein [Candidatus Caccalectryoclostridium excrementigallinarum]
MKKILKISVLVLIVAIVSVGLLAACEDPVTPGVPDVQQESNDVFYWAPVAGAEYYVMSVDDGENQTIAATSATVHEDNAEYAAMRFKLDTSALTAGVHSVKFAAGAGELVSEFGKSFRVVVGSGFVAAPEVWFNGDTIYVNTAAPTVDVTFTANNSPVTVTYERGVDDVTPIELNIEELLGSTELEDGVTYVVTATAKDGEVSSDASRAVKFTYSAPDKQYAKPAVSLELADEPYLIFNNDVTEGATVTFDLGGKYYSAEYNGTSDGSLTMSPISYFMDDELNAVMIANAGTEMQFSFRVDYVDYAASEPAIASEWSDPVTLSIPAVELEDWLDNYFDYAIGSLGNGTVAVVDKTVGTALEGSVTVEVKMNETPVEATVGNDSVKVYKAEVSEGVNTVEMIFTWGEQTYSVQEKFEVGEKVYGLHINGSNVLWSPVDDAEKYVVSVTGDPYGNAYTNEYETETTSFDFDEVASYDDYAVGMYEVTVYAVVDGVNCAESEVLSLRRAAAPQGYNLSESADSFTVYNDEYYNYNLIVKANGVEISHDTYNERNYIISKDRLYNSANGTLEIEFYYEGNDLDMLDSRPATYSFEVSDKLDYRIVDGDKIEIIGADLVNDHVYVNGTSYSAGSSNGYVTEDGMFEILDYVADNSDSVGIMGTVKVMPSFGAIAPYDVNLRARGFTINVNSNRAATPSLTTDYDQVDAIVWDGNDNNTYGELERGKQGTWEYIIEYTDADGNSTSEADSGTIVNYDTCGASVDMSGFEDPGVYTISIRAKGTGNKFSSRYTTATYLIFDEIDTQINTGADSSYVSVSRQGSVLDYYIAGYDYQYRYYHSSYSWITTSDTYTTTSLYTDGYRFDSYMSNSSYNIASVTFEMNLSTNANYVFYKALPDKTVEMDRIYVDYNNYNYDAIYYVTEGGNAQAAWVRPELYTTGGDVYYTVMTRTENYSGWDYTSHYTTGSTMTLNNTTYVKVEISNTTDYIFSPDRVNGNGTTEKVDYIFVKDGESILDALGKLNINTSYAFFTDSLCTTEVTKDLLADASSGSTTVYVGNAPVTA